MLCAQCGLWMTICFIITLCECFEGMSLLFYALKAATEPETFALYPQPTG